MVSYQNTIQVVINSRLCYHLYILWWTSMGLGRWLAEPFVFSTIRQFFSSEVFAHWIDKLL